MTQDRNPLTQRYLQQLGAALDRTVVREDERPAILGEIESHLAEAVHSGARLTEVLERLGPAEDLARAYAVELALNPRPATTDSAQRRVLSAVTRASATVAALLLVLVMGALGVGFVIGGVASVVAGLVAPFLPSEWLDPTLRVGVPQLVVVLIGMVLLGVGVVSIRIVKLNARFLFGALRRDSRKVLK